MLNTKLKKRDLYLNCMIAFQDKEMIKVVTGIRRCGKSSLMKLMAEHLKFFRNSTINLLAVPLFLAAIIYAIVSSVQINNKEKK